MSAVVNEELSHAGDGIVLNKKFGSWKFDDAVSRVFDSHVSKSVPLYDAGHDLVLRLSDYYMAENSVCYEVGCSTGTLSLKLAQRHKEKNGVMVVGIDPSESMIDVAIEKAIAAGSENLNFFCNDALCFDFGPSDFIVMYYVCQFIPPKNRLEMLKAAYKSLNPGGALILFEKIREDNSEHNECISQIYMDYKSDQGFESDEILSKTRSLKGVMKTFTRGMNSSLLEDAGFDPGNITPVMKYMQFEGYLIGKS